MDVLKKTLRKLSNEEYQELLLQVAGKKKNKPFIVMETTRNSDMEDKELMAVLQVNPSTYYTLKSRLNDKIASILSRRVNNPISALMEEVARVPAILYGTNKEFAIRALIELEKQLIEYDMSSELITVYKTLATLHLHSADYDHYDNLYKKHVAFSLAAAKAEQLFHQFIIKMGNYQLTREQSDLEEVIIIKREISNICEMYESHRLYVLYNIVRVYYLCSISEKYDGLKSRELEIDSILVKMNDIFQKYPLDTLYQNIKPIINFLFFEYYSKTGNEVRADFYHDKIKDELPDWCSRHSMAYFVTEYMNSKVDLFLHDGNVGKLCGNMEDIVNNFDADITEHYHYVSFKKYQAIIKFYQHDYQGAARKMNELRNDLSLRNYLFTEVECKLFQALQYCIMGEDGLCLQIISSLKRQIREGAVEYKSAQIFIKFIKATLKPTDFRKKIKRVTELWNSFNAANTGTYSVLRFIKIDDALLRKMTNPIKD